MTHAPCNSRERICSSPGKDAVRHAAIHVTRARERRAIRHAFGCMGTRRHPFRASRPVQCAPALCAGLPMARAFLRLPTCTCVWARALEPHAFVTATRWSSAERVPILAQWLPFIASLEPHASADRAIRLQQPHGNCALHHSGKAKPRRHSCHGGIRSPAELARPGIFRRVTPPGSGLPDDVGTASGGLPCSYP